MKDITEYQERTKLTAKPLADDSKATRDLIICNWSMGLAGETGELVDLIKKHVHHGHDLDLDKVVKEMGDVTWYLAMLANELNISLEEVLKANLIKLSSRYQNGFSEKASRERNV